MPFNLVSAGPNTHLVIHPYLHFPSIKTILGFILRAAQESIRAAYLKRLQIAIRPSQYLAATAYYLSQLAALAAAYDHTLDYGVDLIAKLWEERATQQSPNRTGRMRNSIRTIPRNDETITMSYVFYTPPYRARERDFVMDALNSTQTRATVSIVWRFLRILSLLGIGGGAIGPKSGFGKGGGTGRARGRGRTRSGLGVGRGGRGRIR